jgi:SH3-like domain-containing protein
MQKKGHEIFFLTLFILISFSHPCYSLDFVSIKSNKAILYEGPSETTKKEFIITKDYPLNVIVRLKDWIKVKDHLGKISWIQIENISKDRNVMTLKDNTNLFYKPSVESVHLAKIEKNVALKLLSPFSTNGWIQVKTLSQNIEGYIRTEDVWGL